MKKKAEERQKLLRSIERQRQSRLCYNVDFSTGTISDFLAGTGGVMYSD